VEGCRDLAGRYAALGGWVMAHQTAFQGYGKVGGRSCSSSLVRQQPPRHTKEPEASALIRWNVPHSTPRDEVDLAEQISGIVCAAGAAEEVRKQ